MPHAAPYTLITTPEGDSVLDDFDERLTNILGIPAQELRKSAAAVYLATHPEDLEEAQEAMSTARTGQLFHVVTRYNHPRRGERVLDWTSSVTVEPHKVRRFEGRVIDRTVAPARRAATQALLRALAGGLDLDDALYTIMREWAEPCDDCPGKNRVSDADRCEHRANGI